MAIYEWTRLPACGDQPSPRRSCAAAIIPPDPEGTGPSGLLVIGGLGIQEGRKQYFHSWYFAELSTKVVWHEMAPELPDEIARYDAAACWCPKSKRMLVFGGSRHGSYYNDLHALTVDLEGHTGDVVRVRSAGRRPMPRSNTTLIHLDSAWLFGGCNLTSFPASIFDDVWCFDGQWIRLDVNLGPCARAGHACTKIEDGLIVAGGWNGKGILGDLWTLTGLPDCPMWAQLSTEIPQRARCGIGMLDGVAIVFGGINNSSAMFREADEDMVHSCDPCVVHVQSSRSQRAAVVGTAPTRRAFMVSAVVGSSLICAMGSNSTASGMFNDVYVLAPCMWSPEAHHQFPRAFRKRVYLWLLLQVRLQLLPKELWLIPIHFLTAHDFVPQSDTRSIADRMREMLSKPAPPPHLGGRTDLPVYLDFVTVR